MSGTSQQADVGGSGNIVVQIVGDGNTANFEPGQPALWLTAYDSPLFAEVEAVAPSTTPRPGYTATGLEEAGLLRPYTRSFALRGRDAPLAELRAWLASDRPVSVMVVVGAGGRGKTRLALELCAEAAGDGWHAGFVTHDEMERFHRQQALAAWDWNRDVLAVVDYAAAKAGPLRAWLEALAHHPAWRTPGHKKLRLLLLNREGGPDAAWWKQAFGEGGAKAAAVRRMIARDRPLALDPLDEPADRLALFAEAHRRASGADPPMRLDLDRLLEAQSLGGEPLFLAMSGLLTARQGMDAALRLQSDELALRLAEDELDRIGRFWASRGLPALGDPPLHAHLAAAVTLAGELPAAAARELVALEAEAFGIALPGGPEAARAALHAALPAPGGGVAPLLPDILGEAGLILTWGERQDGIAALLRVARKHRANATRVVVRACQDFLIRGRRAPLAWLKALRADSTDLEALLPLVEAMPASTLELSETALELAQTFADLARDQAEEMGQAGRALLGSALLLLSDRRAGRGQLEEALAAIEEAVGIFRDLTATWPDALLPELAQSLTRMSLRLADLGRREEALAAGEEAVAMCRDLAAACPDRPRNAFAVWLVMRWMGARKSSRPTEEEAAAMRRGLDTGRPADLGAHTLAASLANLSSRLADLSRQEEALAAIEEAVAAYRPLAAARPDPFLPELAQSLTSMSALLADLGRQEEGLAAGEEAVAALHSVAGAQPLVSAPHAAEALSNVGVQLWNLGRREEALEAFCTSIALYGPLAELQPSEFLPAYARSVTLVSRCFANVGRLEEALTFGEDAVAAYRPLAAARPDALLPELAQSLTSVSAILAELGRQEEALAAIEEAVSIHHGLAVATPDTFLPDFAASCCVRGEIAASRDPGGAAVSFAQGIAALRAPFLDQATAFAPLMTALHEGYVAACDAAGTAVDEVLLAPVMAAFDMLSTDGVAPEEER